MNPNFAANFEFRPELYETGVRESCIHRQMAIRDRFCTFIITISLCHIYKPQLFDSN